MELGAITIKNYNSFSSLLLPDMAEAIRRDQMVIAYGVVEKDTAVGAVAGVFSEESFQIRSLYVAPAYRRKGYGTALLKAVLSLMEEEYIPVTISFTVTEPEHELLCPFLEKFRFTKEEQEEENIFCSDLRALSKNPLFTKRTEEFCPSFSELDPKAFYGLELRYKRMEHYIPMPEGGFFGAGVERDLSCACVMGGEIMAFLTVENIRDGFLISSVWSKTPQAAMVVLRSTGARLLNNYPPETKLAFQTINSASYLLAKKLLPEITPISYTYNLNY